MSGDEGEAAVIVREAFEVNPEFDADYAARVLQTPDPSRRRAARCRPALTLPRLCVWRGSSESDDRLDMEFASSTTVPE